MPLSNSRQQFLAYESHGSESARYRKGGIFISTCICVGFVICAVLLCALVGIIVHFITFFKLSQKSGDFWEEQDPFKQTSVPSPDLRLPADVIPSFYRLKLVTDIEHSNFSGEVYITLRANKKVKKIILHSKNLHIKPDATLREQIYQKVETLQRSKRDVNKTVASNETTDKNISNKDNVTTNNVTKPSDVQTTLVELDNLVTTTPFIDTSTQVNKSTKNFSSIIVPTTPSSAQISESTKNFSPIIVPELSTTEVNEINPVTNEVEHSNIEMNDGSQVINTTVDTNTQVTHSSVRNVKISSITSSSGDRLILTLDTALKTDVDYTLQLSFNGEISNSLTGFYKSSYVNSNGETKTLAVTQFEPTSARAAFPCFDEPEFKAQFEISIAHPSQYTALSNMKVATQEPMPEKPDWQWTHFERSVHMSTYLVAYILSDFKSQETSYLSKDNITKPIRIWTRPELKSKTKYALSIAPKLLTYYEELFGVPYVLDKIDLIAIPDFSSGAMENWGLITFRETTLVYDEETGVPRDKMTVAVGVAHELAHQWFGNLVTMRWWDDLWLNEGFATYIEYVAVNRIQPKWGMLEAFSRDKMDLLRSDALKSTSPVSKKVVDALEISQKFDEISYTKGANLIRMLNHTISEAMFHKGLLYYLNQWKFRNAEENDLWQAMSSSSRGDPGLENHSLVEFMNSWTRQAGYPALTVTRDYKTGDVKFEQKLFTSSKKPYKSAAKQLWHIPISYTKIPATSNSSTRPQLWLTRQSLVKTLPVMANETLYVNVDAIGYYRVNYDHTNWELLSRALKSGIIKSPVTRSQLLDDAFNLAKANQLNYSLALDLTTFMINGESSKMVWDLLLNNMAFLRLNLKATSGFSYFQDFMKILLQKQLQKLNYGLNKPKDDNEALLVENLLMWECYVESERCLTWARTEFDKWMAESDFNNNPIPRHVRSVVYNMALRRGGRREFDFLWRVYRNTTDPALKTFIITTLPATNEPNLITMLLEKSLSEIPQQYAMAVWNVEPPTGTAIAQRFLIDNFERALRRFTSMDAFMFPSVMTGAFGMITSEQELNQLKTLALKHKNELMSMSQSLQKMVDTATLRIEWIRRHAAEINEWFRTYVESHSPSHPMATSGA